MITIIALLAIYASTGIFILSVAVLLECRPEEQVELNRRHAIGVLFYMVVWPLFWLVLACVKYEVPSSFEAKDARSNRL